MTLMPPAPDRAEYFLLGLTVGALLAVYLLVGLLDSGRLDPCWSRMFP